MRRQNDGFDELIRGMLEKQTDEVMSLSYSQHLTAAKELKKIYDAFMAAGFSEWQEFDVVKSIVTTATHGEEE